MAGLSMGWARIMAPVAGGEADKAVLAFAAALAEPFQAELACVYAPADVADLMPWMGEGFMGGVQVTAVQSLKDAAAEGEKAARAASGALGYASKTFTALSSPVWSALSMEGRLSDVVVFDDATAKGKGPLAESFQQIVADEQRPTIVARAGLSVGGTVAVAWQGSQPRGAHGAAVAAEGRARGDPGRAGLVGALFRPGPAAAVLQPARHQVRGPDRN
jgi:hypothetical protein